MCVCFNRHMALATDFHVCIDNLWKREIKKIRDACPQLVLNCVCAIWDWWLKICETIRHSSDSHVTYGANNIRVLHPLHNRRYVLLLKLKVPLVLFNNRHFCGTEYTVNRLSFSFLQCISKNISTLPQAYNHFALWHLFEYYYIYNIIQI